MTATVAALYVSRSGPYWGRADVDAWDEERDARRYAGPLPVVAHPPCQLWTNMAGVNYRRYAGAHNRPGNDGGCFMRALECVRRFGGVLEHPAGSWAWSTFALTRPPSSGGWARCSDGTGYVCEVWQSAYGHRARKRTWLYYASPEDWAPPELDWSQNPGTHQVGWFDRKRPTLSKSEAIVTPPAFAEVLLSLARHSRQARDA